MFFEIERIGRLISEINTYIYPETKDLNEIYIKKGDFKSIEEAEASEGPWLTFNKSDRWGGKDQRYWFKTGFTIPTEFDGKAVVFHITTGREGQWDAVNPQFLIYSNGELIQGLDVNHREIILTKYAKSGEGFSIYLSAYSGMQEGLAEFSAKISILDELIEKIYYDIKVPLDVAKLLDPEDKRRIDILNYLTCAVNLLDLRKPFSCEFYMSLKQTEKYLADEFYDKYCGAENITADCIGHTHIDVAWLWTLMQTREKTVRSFSTVLNLMKQYPEYLFMASQPQLYEFLKEDYPKIYEKLKEKVKEGSWEAEGAMWLEADCNLISGESIIRQILSGKRFFREEFGVESKILWLPDVFGYSAALPQILRKSGINYFLTTKISWNEYNKLPYDTFNWEGIDGSEVLSYFVTTADYEKVMEGSHRTVYEGHINPSQIMGAWRRYQQKNINDEILVSFGYGDGGGGPTKEMLENARRLEKGIPGCPKVKMVKALDFFKALENKISHNKRLPKWVGELYLEYHRGTYTTMARNKRYNRKSEFLYEDAEAFNTLNSVLNKSAYPYNELRKGWKKILLNQFHDIIPGSSIKEVYEESKEQYEEIISTGSNLLNTALDNICSNINSEEKSLVVFNELGFKRDGIVKFDIPDNMKDAEYLELADSEGTYPIQILHDNKAAAFVRGIPSKGYKAYKIRKISRINEIADYKTKVSERAVSNKFFNICLDENGNISSIFDKSSNREILKPGSKANMLQAFEDKPHNFDAWDINIYYEEKMWEITDVQEIKVLNAGPVMTTIKIIRKFLDSTITQFMHVYNDIPRIDFENIIDWKEKQILLKAAFPVDIHANKAVYEIQYGNIERPTYQNTSWDMAKFEVCAHKWADISEDGYGVSLLNDCKYGYDIKGSLMRLSLLRSPVWPNPDADREIHSFTYSLYPHKGDFREGRTVQEAYDLNCPLYARLAEPHKGSLPDEYSLVSCNKDNVVIEVLKKAEKDDDIIIRMYECYNRRSDVTVSLGKAFEYVRETDLEENVIAETAEDNALFSFLIKPFEIKTFKIKFKN